MDQYNLLLLLKIMYLPVSHYELPFEKISKQFASRLIQGKTMSVV